MLEYVILGFLSERSLTGYEIKQIMSHSTSNFIDASFGSIYPTLTRLEKNALITFVENTQRGKFKKEYSITEKGQTTLLEWLRIPCKYTPFNYEFLAKLFFYELLAKKEITRLIQAFIKSVEAEIDKLEKIHQACPEQIGFYQLATLRFGKECYQQVIDWHKRLLKEIKE